MEIVFDLMRTFKGKDYTIGKLSVGNRRICDTMEDTDRGLNNNMSLSQIQKLKISHKTAIPTGKYPITLDTQSPRFKSKKQYAFCKGYLPRLIDVPGYNGVLIHIGNTPADTDGCILVGENKVKGQVINSTATFSKIYNIMKRYVDDGNKIFINIH